MEPGHHQAVAVIEPDSPRAGGDGTKEGNSFNYTGQKEAQDSSRNGGNQENISNNRPAQEAAAAADPLLNDTRGWLLTVAVLFVTLAFEAVLTKPDWLQLEWFSRKGLAERGTQEIFRAYFYLFGNMVTFASALTAVVLLMWEKGTLVAVKRLMQILSLSLACAFAACISADWWMTLLVLIGMVMYAASAAALVLGMHEWLLQRFRNMVLGKP